MTQPTSDTTDISKLSISQLRELSKHTTDSRRDIEVQTAIVIRSINEDHIRIGSQHFVTRYLDGLMSSNPDESEYTLKQLNRLTGDMRKGFRIIDDRTGEEIFDVPSLVPVMRTSLGSAATEESSSQINKEFHESQYTTNAKVREQNIKVLVANSFFQMNPIESEQDFYDSWYEIFDFFGRLYGTEQKQYQVIKAHKQSVGNMSSFWCNPLSFDEYIEKHGRLTYSFIPPKEEGIEEPTSPVSSSASATKQEMTNDTSDWE